MMPCDAFTRAIDDLATLAARINRCTTVDEAAELYHEAIALEGHAITLQATARIDAVRFRRNLTPKQASLLRGRRYNRTKKSEGRPEKQLAQNEPVSTAERLAEQHGVTERTIRQDTK